MADVIVVERAEAGPGLGGMVPSAGALTQVLPTGRLNERAKPLPPLRDELRRTHGVRNALNVASVWVQSFGLIALMCWLTPKVPLVLALSLWALTFLLMGR